MKYKTWLLKCNLSKILLCKFTIDFSVILYILMLENNTGSLAEGIRSADPGTPLYKKYYLKTFYLVITYDGKSLPGILNEFPAGFHFS